MLAFRALRAEPRAPRVATDASGERVDDVLHPERVPDGAEEVGLRPEALLHLEEEERPLRRWLRWKRRDILGV